MANFILFLFIGSLGNLLFLFIGIHSVFSQTNEACLEVVEPKPVGYFGTPPEIDSIPNKVDRNGWHAAF